MALLYGKPVADRILSEIKDRIEQTSIRPGLAVVLVGDDLESQKYVGLKEAQAHEVGIHFEKHLFPKTVPHEEIFDALERLNGREDIHGIIVQLPLPAGFPTDEIIAHIDPKKDTDGFHQETLKRFLLGESRAFPVFPRAVVELLRSAGTLFHGDKAVVVANSDLMGKVLSFALSLEGLSAEYILSSEGYDAITEKTRTARVVVTACGIPDLLDASMLTSNTIVIDGGNVHVNEKVQGDVKRQEVEKKIAFLSPVPGGVGPVTVATLLNRVMDAALKQD